MEDRQRPDFAGIVYRQSTPRYAEHHPHLGRQLPCRGRFDGVNEFGALYVSLDPETPLRELRRACARAGVDVSMLLPRTFFAAEACLYRVLDLTCPRVQPRWGLTSASMADDDWTACQAVARGARNGGYEAIRFPSAAGRGENLAIFLDRLAAGSSVRILREAEVQPGFS